MDSKEVLARKLKNYLENIYQM